MYTNRCLIFDFHIWIKNINLQLHDPVLLNLHPVTEKEDEFKHFL